MTVLGEDKIHVSVDGVLRTLAAPDWQNNLAQHTARDHSYIARRDRSFVTIAGQFDDKPFVEVLGNLEPIGLETVLRYDGQFDIRSKTFNAAVDIGLEVNLGSEFSRLRPILRLLKLMLGINQFGRIIQPRICDIFG